MKGKAKGGGTKAVAKEVMPAIEGLGVSFLVNSIMRAASHPVHVSSSPPAIRASPLQTGVPDPVRDAYLALVQSEPEDRPGAVVALRAAVMGNKSAASHLALAKGLIYRAMDTAVITKAHSKDVWAQMARDKDATKILQEALKEAAEGANKYKSQLCFVSLNPSSFFRHFSFLQLRSPTPLLRPCPPCRCSLRIWLPCFPTSPLSTSSMKTSAV